MILSFSVTVGHGQETQNSLNMKPRLLTWSQKRISRQFRMKQRRMILKR